MKGSCFPRKDNDPDYIVAWKYKYDFKAGKYAEKVMTYGEAKRRAEELCAEHPDKTFWPEPVAEPPKGH